MHKKEVRNLVNIDKIKSLSQEKGIKLGYLAKKINVPHTYFADIKNKKRDIPDERLSVIAEELGTTVAYLRDQTAEKESSESSTASFTTEEVSLIESYRNSPENVQKAVKALLDLGD